MAPDSNTEIRRPPGPSGSTMAGMRLLGEIARKCRRELFALGNIHRPHHVGQPHSSSMIEIFQPFGVGQ